MVRRVVVVIVLALLLAACSSNRQLTTIDRRLTHLEQAQADRSKQLDEIDVRIRALAVALAALAEVGQAQDLARQLEQLTSQIAALKASLATKEAARPGRPGPDPAAVYAVGVAGAPSEGPADALVTIVRAYEYACPYCEKSRATMAELRTRYPDEVRIVYRAFIVHPATATLPAEAACAAHKQGLFREADQRLWDEAYANRKFDQAQMELIAIKIDADIDRFRADMRGACSAQVAADQAALTRVGVTGTPAFYVNGRFLSGAQPVAAFVKLVDEELALARSRLGKKNVKKARGAYYDTWVVARGQTEVAAAAQP